MAPAPVARREHLGQTVAADGSVVGDHRWCAAALAIEDVEILGQAVDEGFLRNYRVDARDRRRVFPQPVDQILYLFGIAAGFNFQALAIFSNPAGQVELLGQAPDEWAEADALDNAAKFDALADDV